VWRLEFVKGPVVRRRHTKWSKDQTRESKLSLNYELHHHETMADTL
jgi:hypothetical protein